MSYPQKAKSLKVNDAKLGGKYRMSNIREFIALAYLLYISSGRQSSVDYSDGENRQDRLALNKEYEEKIGRLLDIGDVNGVLSKNPLLTGQFEYILVAMERVFCMGSVRFNNPSYNNSKERTGGTRYPKTLLFSTNMLLLDLIVTGFEKDVRKECLKAWLQNKKANNDIFEKKVSQFLTICTQFSLFRSRVSETEDVIYRPIGIYEELANGNDVSIVDYKEQAGTSSIYNNVLKEGLNPWLDSKNTDRINLNPDMDIKPYLEMLRTTLGIIKVSESEIGSPVSNTNKKEFERGNSLCIYDKILAAIRTKPFILLAGISGTGKSRIVRKLAQMTVTEELQRKYDKEYNGTDFENDRWNLHTPANFKLIQVKPNWHNSMDVVGYLTNIPEPHYVFTPFVEFIARAWQHQDIPFFLCLDEMNLAPVEEYFAEFLSAIESRAFETHNGEKVYVTDPIIKSFDSFGPTCCGEMMRQIRQDMMIDLPLLLENKLRHKGLTLPKNLIVIGTVNMDETTYSFSRKVLDRAMSFEMNDVDYAKFLEGKTDDELKAIREELKDNLNELLTDRHIEAKEIISQLGEDAGFVVDYLDKVNKLLEGTPFKLGYRAANEAMLYVMAARETHLGDVLTAMNDFTLMKILSRFEGDSAKMRIDPKDKRLKELGYDSDDVKDKRPETTDRDTITILTCMHKIIEDMLMPATTTTETEGEEASLFTEEGETKAEVTNQENKQLSSLVKLETMMDQLNRERFVSYWN